MPLPDLSRLAAAPPATLRAFGHELAAIGVSLAAAAPFVERVRNVHPALRHPARAYHLRKRRDATGYALRMFLFEDPVTPEEAREALGDTMDAMLEVGLLARTDAGVVSPFVMGLVDDLFVLSDALHHGDEAVMGLGETTVALGRAALSRRPAKRALDLGCGSGMLALLLARSASAVVATDINPRAVAMARVNAALNGVRGVEVRQGDRFAPVEGETFDLVVSQPPFVPKPEGAGDIPAFYGGSRGDELAISVLAALPKHLARGGRAVLLVEWPDIADAPLERRLRDALGSGPNLLVLRAPPADVDAELVGYAAGLHPRLGPGFEADTMARLAHLDQKGIRELVPTLVVVERPAEQGAASGGWTGVVPVEPLASVAITSERLDAMLAARALVRRGDAAVLGATLRVPDGTVFSQVQVGPGAEVPSTLHARFAPSAGMQPIDLTMELLFLVTIVHESSTVAEAIPRCAEALQISVEEARAKALTAVAEALEYGLLEIAARSS